MRLSLFDLLFELTSNSQRSLDFTFYGELNKPTTLRNLELGAKIAFEKFPQSNSTINRYDFVICEEAWKVNKFSGNHEYEIIKDFINDEFNLKKSRGIKQLLITKSDGRQILVTRMHHAVGDGLSLFMWLEAQLCGSQVSNDEMQLLGKPNVVSKKSAYEFSKPCQVYKEFKRGNGSSRDWLSFKISNVSLAPNLTLNDSLIAIFLKALEDVFALERRGVYLPINIRKFPFKGFGNGSSRIKIYDIENTDLIEKAHSIRKQKNDARNNGLWYQRNTYNRMFSKFIFSKIINKYSKMNTHDYGSFVFSHIQKLGPYETVLNHFKTHQFISQIFHPYSFTVIVLGETCTITWDRNLISKEKIVEYSEKIINLK